MQHLLQNLLQRWEQAFDEPEALFHYKSLVKTILYADGLRFDLEKFDRNSFPSGGPMSNEKDGIEPRALHEYGFNADGFPCYVTFRHDYNEITWEGLYSYSDTFVEYVEYCLNTGVPSAIQRVIYQGKRKVSYQSISINGRGSAYSRAQMSKEEIIHKIKNDDFSIISTVTQFHYDFTKIKKATNIHITPSIGQFSSYDEYTYDENQNLDAIRRFFEEGNNRLIYCKVPEGMSAESIIENVAQEMAKSISEALAQQDIEEPIAFLELNYHYADNYIPLLVWKTAREVEDQLANNEFEFINEYHDAIQPDRVSFEKLFAMLELMMDESDDASLGRVMLRRAASLLTTNKLSGIVKVSNDFAAYAVDWSIEGHSNEHFEEILLECGVKANVIKEWKKKGILPDPLK
jgi:hypothetical protein